MVATGHYHGMYLGDPDIDFVKLGECQGVKGIRVTSAADIEGALKKGIKEVRDGKPFIVEIVVQRIGGGADSTWHQKYSVAKQGATNAQ
jgi:thiamine pyrophosphate-dependent acetolactate synthase large subunit-like protein